MKSISISSIILFLAVMFLAVYTGSREINHKIEESIKANLESEISILKDKINKQSELINSIINVNDKENQNQNQNQNTDSQLPSTDENTDSDNVVNEAIPEFEYIVENGGITITKYLGKQTSVQIPNMIGQLPVRKIGERAFADSKVKSVTIPKDCTEIDWFAFYGCYALTTVHIPKSVQSIGYGAFDGCSKRLTIYCDNNSFAHQYATSFGISFSN